MSLVAYTSAAILTASSLRKPCTHWGEAIEEAKYGELTVKQATLQYEGAKHYKLNINMLTTSSLVFTATRGISFPTPTPCADLVNSLIDISVHLM